MSYVGTIDLAWTLVEKLRKVACLYEERLPFGLATDIEALGALLDEGGILDAAMLATDPDVEPTPILVDVAEQRPVEPWTWRKAVRATKTRSEVPAHRAAVPTSRANLEWGDYAPADPALRQWALVERKGADWVSTLFGSSQDAVGEVAPNLTRFRRELLAMAEMNRRGGRACVQIELTYPQILGLLGPRVSPVSLEAFQVDIWYDYGVPVFVLGGRERSAFWIGHGFSRMAEQAQDARAARKATRRGLVLPWAWKEAGNGEV